MTFVKIKVGTIKQEVIDVINSHANLLGLYDVRFPEKDQCSGYHAFKELCFIKGKIPFYIEDYNETNKFTGYYLLAQLHPNLRQTALGTANNLRKKYNLQ